MFVDHEPLPNGFPLPAEHRRITATQGLASCVKLAKLLDRDLAEWMLANSQLRSASGTNRGDFDARNVR
jgi:hypothetical protein